MKLESAVDADDEILAEVFRVLSKLAENFDVPDGRPIVDWMLKNVFKRSKDDRKLIHLKNILDGANTKTQLRHKFETMAVNVLENAALRSTSVSSGELLFILLHCCHAALLPCCTTAMLHCRCMI